MDTRKLRFTLERLDPMTVAFSCATGEDAPSKAIGPLVKLYFQTAEAAFLRENGRSHRDEEEYLIWMFSTRYHLSPNIRWFGLPEAPPRDHGASQNYEFWVMTGDRVQVDGQVETKQVNGGLYAAIEYPFEPEKLSEFWQALENRVDEAGLQKTDRLWLEEHLQTPNRGGFCGFRLLLPVEETSLPSS